MTLEQTMQCMFDDYPALFRTRRDCLNHLFCVIGNGYEWHNGRLMVVYTEDGKTVYCDEPSATPLVDGKAFQHKPDPYHVKRNFHWYFHVTTPTGGVIHHDLCKSHSYLWNYPEDIQPDWLAGIEECKTLLRADGIINEDDEFAI